VAMAPAATTTVRAVTTSSRPGADTARTPVARVPAGSVRTSAAVAWW